MIMKPRCTEKAREWDDKNKVKGKVWHIEGMGQSCGT